MKNRRGVSLIEVVVAMVLFALIATVHTVATMQYGLRQRVAAIGSARTTALSTAVDLFSSMPRTEIAAAATCETISDIPAFPYTRCVTVTAATGNITRVQIVIAPSDTALRSDTVWVDRTTKQYTPPFK